MAVFRKGKETPTEQLLRMIEGPQGAATAKPVASGVHVGQRLRDFVQDVQAWIGRLVLPSHREADVFLWNLRMAHRVLWLLLAGLGAYVALDLVVGSKPHISPKLVTTGAEGQRPTPVEPDHSLATLSEYLVAVKQRNPFTGEGGLLDRSSGKTAKRKLEELAEGLVVVGIDRGTHPVALVEHAAQRRTYMVKTGEQINGMTVKKIGAEGVVVTYEGEEMTLP